MEGTGGPDYTSLQYLHIHSLVHGGKKTSRKKSNSCSFSPFCAGQTSLSSSLSREALLCIAIGLQMKEEKHCLFLQPTAQKQGSTSLWRQETEKETMSMYVQVTYLCFAFLLSSATGTGSSPAAD